MASAEHVTDILGNGLLVVILAAMVALVVLCAYLLVRYSRSSSEKTQQMDQLNQSVDEIREKVRLIEETTSSRQEAQTAAPSGTATGMPEARRIVFIDDRISAANENGIVDRPAGSPAPAAPSAPVVQPEQPEQLAQARAEQPAQVQTGQPAQSVQTARAETAAQNSAEAAEPAGAQDAADAAKVPLQPVDAGSAEDEALERAVRRAVEQALVDAGVSGRQEDRPRSAAGAGNRRPNAEPGAIWDSEAETGVWRLEPDEISRADIPMPRVVRETGTERPVVIRKENRPVHVEPEQEENKARTAGGKAGAESARRRPERPGRVRRNVRRKASEMFPDGGDWPLTEVPDVSERTPGPAVRRTASSAEPDSGAAVPRAERKPAVRQLGPDMTERAATGETLKPGSPAEPEPAVGTRVRKTGTRNVSASVWPTPIVRTAPETVRGNNPAVPAEPVRPVEPEKQETGNIDRFDRFGTSRRSGRTGAPEGFAGAGTPERSAENEEAPVPTIEAILNGTAAPEPAEEKPKNVYTIPMPAAKEESDETRAFLARARDVRGEEEPMAEIPPGASAMMERILSGEAEGEPDENTKISKYTDRLNGTDKDGVTHTIEELRRQIR